MAVLANRRLARPLHPLLAFLLAAALPLFLGGLLSDWAYASNYEIQWSNFAAWLIAGAMVFTGFALLWAVIAMLRPAMRHGRGVLLLVLLLAIFVLGLVNSFVHARDAYGVMPEGLVLSIIVTLLALVATWIGFAGLRAGETK